MVVGSIHRSLLHVISWHHFLSYSMTSLLSTERQELLKKGIKGNEGGVNFMDTKRAWTIIHYRLDYKHRVNSVSLQKAD